MTPACSPAAVFGPGDKLVSDSHVINKGHVVIGTGAALIDWVYAICSHISMIGIVHR
jgi:hypothetical protein